MIDPIPAPAASHDVAVKRSAQAMVATWRAQCAALGPIIGVRGTAALFQRSVHLTGAAHPWMLEALHSIDVTIDFQAFEALLVQQTQDDIATGGAALVRHLRHVLAGLIGSSLADRLLRSVPVHSPSRVVAQEGSP